MKRFAILSGSLELNDGPVLLQKNLVKIKEFLLSENGGSWKDDEILILGGISWDLCQILEKNLKEYDFIFFYRCDFHNKKEKLEFSEKLKDFINNRGIFINDFCDEIVEV